jgi:hypothetical protein
VCLNPCFDSLNTNCLNAVSCPYLSTAVGGTGLYLNSAGKSTTDLRAFFHHAACTGADLNSTTADGLRKDARNVFEIAPEELFSKMGDANVKYSFPYNQTNASEDIVGDPMEKAASLNGVSSQWVECADLAPVLLRLALLIWAVCSSRRRSGPKERFANQTHRNQRFALALLVLLVPQVSAVATTAPPNGDGTGEHLAESAQTPPLQPLRPLPLTQLCADDVNSGALDSNGAPMPCSYFSAQPSACASYFVARTTCPMACDMCSPLQPGPSGKMVFSEAVTSDHPVAGLQHAPSYIRSQQAQQTSGIPILTSTPSTPSTSAGSSLVTGPPFQRPPLPPSSVSSPPLSLPPSSPLSSPLPPLSAPTPLPPRPPPQLPLPRPQPSPPTSMPPSMHPLLPSLDPPNSGPTPPWSLSPPASPEHLWLPLILPPPPVWVPSPPPQWSALMAPPPLPCTVLPCTKASDNDAPGLHSMQLVPSHRRELQTSVSTVADLTSALANTAVGRIVLASGTYYLIAELSITRSVVLEAAVAGSVILNAQASSSSPRRVLSINPGPSGVVQLIGLNITGGYVRALAQKFPSPLMGMPR